MTRLPQPRGRKPSANPAPAHRWEFCATGSAFSRSTAAPCRKEGSLIVVRLPPVSCAFPSILRAKSKAGKSATTANLRPCCWHIKINFWRYPKATTFTSDKDDEPGRVTPFRPLTLAKKEGPPLQAALHRAELRSRTSNPYHPYHHHEALPAGS